MSAARDLARFEAESGAGYDSAGRRVYTGPQFLYSGPGDKAATQAVHQALGDRANFEDGGGLIRALLQERNRNAARYSGVDPASWLDLAAGNKTLTIDNSFRPVR